MEKRYLKQIQEKKMKSGRSIWLFAAVMLFFLSGTANSQEKRTLSLDEAVRLGLENSHQLNISRLQVRSADARWSEINSARLPSLKFNAIYTRLSDIDPFNIETPFGNFELTPNIVNTYTFRLTLQQPIFTGFRLSSSSNIAEYNYRAQEQQYNADREELILNIKTAYWNVFKAIRFLNVVEENVGQIKAHLNDVQNLFNEGLATKNDVLKVQVQLAEAELRHIDTRNQVRLSKVNLSNILGIPLSSDVEIQKDIKPDLIDVENLDVFVESAYQNRPELKSIEYRMKAGERGVTLARSGWYPQLFVTGNYNYAQPNQRIFPQQEEFKGTWDVSVALSWDIWNWGSTSNQTEQASASLEQARESFESVKDNISLEVTQNYLTMQQSREKIYVAENSISQAEENYRVTNEKFRNGLILSSELLDAEVALLQANTNYIQSLVDYEIAKARLEKSSGSRRSK
jgi:outer membrane protein